MVEGWIKLHRRMLTQGWLTNPKLLSFWCWCLLKASHDKHTIIVGHQHVTLEAGQFIFGRKAASQELKQSEQEIRTHLNFLTKVEQNVTIKATNKYSIVSILNWGTYQTTESVEQPTTNQPLTSHQPTTNQPLTTNKNVKNIRSILSPPFFEDFWKTYPKRNGKKVGRKECLEYFKSFTNGDREQVVIAASNYANSKDAREGFSRDPIRFLKKDFWRDWIGNTEGEDKPFENF